MRPLRITLEQVLYILALTLAGVSRLLPLGQTTLNDAESTLALQAYNLVQGTPVSFAPHPLYILGTAALVFLFGASEVTARLLPALAGLALVGLPFLLRNQIGRRAALIMAFLLALDPGMIGSSVQAGSGMLAVTCVLYAFAGWVLGKEILAGVFGGLALLCGPVVWPGLIGLGAARILSHSKNDSDFAPAGFRWRKAGLAALMAVGLVGTLFMRAPSGLSAAGASLPAYFSGFLPGAEVGMPLLLVLGGLAAYEILGLFVGVGGGIIALWAASRNGVHSSMERFLLVWFALAVVLALVYPARQVMDLIWLAPPLLCLAARQVDRMLVLDPSQRRATLFQSGLVLLLLFLIANLVISWPQNQPAGTEEAYRWLVLAIALALLVVEGFLVAWGWSARIALKGLGWGVTALLVLYTLSAAGNAAGLTGRTSAELWRSGPAFSGAAWFQSTVRDFSLWTPNPGPAPEVVISGLESPAVRWSLRENSNLVMVTALEADAQPEMMVTEQDVVLAQTAAYTGQDFIYAQSPAWVIFTPAEWIQWLIYREVPAGKWEIQKLILWVRTDRFPGAGDQTSQP